MNNREITLDEKVLLLFFFFSEFRGRSTIEEILPKYAIIYRRKIVCSARTSVSQNRRVIRIHDTTAERKKKHLSKRNKTILLNSKKSVIVSSTNIVI